MEPDRVCDRQRPEDDEVRLLYPATRPRRERADRELHLTVVGVEQALSDDSQHEDDGARDARNGQRGDHLAPFQTVPGSSLYPLRAHCGHSPFPLLVCLATITEGRI